MASSYGHEQATVKLAAHYEKIDDKQNAQKYYIVASKNGNMDAIKKLDVILNPHDITIKI